MCPYDSQLADPIAGSGWRGDLPVSATVGIGAAARKRGDGIDPSSTEEQLESDPHSLTSTSRQLKHSDQQTMDVHGKAGVVRTSVPDGGERQHVQLPAAAAAGGPARQDQPVDESAESELA